MSASTQVDPAAKPSYSSSRIKSTSRCTIAFYGRRCMRRDGEAAAIPEWEELREIASKIKEHTLTHLDHYLEEFEANATKRGAHVHWARDAAEHNSIVHDILLDTA